MFKIDKIVLRSIEQETYEYKFEFGLNYFKGSNDTGKTVFYRFLDFMFGSSINISNEPWFKDSLEEAELIFLYKNTTYHLKRNIVSNTNYFKLLKDDWTESINLDSYCNKLNRVFLSCVDDIKLLRDFTEEDLTFRAFTLFNFLGEKSLGKMNNFFDKCSEIRYSVKLPSILNYLFNDNLEEIQEVQKEISILELRISALEDEFKKNETIFDIINKNLRILNINIKFKGTNKDAILEHIETIKRLDTKNKKIDAKVKTISELETILNSLEEQIKIYENRVYDTKQFLVENQNQKMMLDELSLLIRDKSEYSYLIEPIQILVKDTEKSISFNKYQINDETIVKLKDEREKIKNQIKENTKRFTSYSLSDKAYSLAIVEDMLGKGVDVNTKEIDTLKEELKNKKNKLKILKNSDNKSKIDKLSNFITELYQSMPSREEGISRDKRIKGFTIQYYKNGNVLQPEVKDNDVKESFYTGSMARHTLIQLCGYLGFLQLLIKEDKYPVIPFFVIDHLSKPFDDKHQKIIGLIFSSFYKKISREDIQIIMFDDESNEDLFIKADNVVNLKEERKSGFNPFY